MFERPLESFRRLNQYLLIATIALNSSIAKSIDLSDDVLVVGEVPGTQKIVVLMDTSLSMNDSSNTITPPSNGGVPIDLWSYFSYPMNEIFRNAKQVDFAMTGIHAPWHDIPEVVIEDLTGEESNGSIDDSLADAVDDLFDAQLEGATPTREAIALGGRFLMCQPGTTNLLLKGVYEDARGLAPGQAKYDCWNTVDYTVDSEAQACAKHSLWFFTDGNFNSDAYPDDPAGLPLFYRQFYGGYLGRNISHLYDGISTLNQALNVDESFLGGVDGSGKYVYPSPYSNPSNYVYVGNVTDNPSRYLIGLSDVAKYLVDIANEVSFNFTFNYAMMTHQGVVV